MLHRNSRRKRETEKIFEYIMAENFPKMKKNVNTHTQKKNDYKQYKSKEFHTEKLSCLNPDKEF